MLITIFEPKMGEVTEEWKKLLNEVLIILYSSPNIVQVVNLKRMRWTGHVARIGGKRAV